MLKGKKGLVMGIANDMSIAWHIAQACSTHGAELLLSYPNDAMKQRVENLGEKIGCKNIFECDVSKTSSIKEMGDAIADKHEKLTSLSMP